MSLKTIAGAVGSRGLLTAGFIAGLPLEGARLTCVGTGIALHTGAVLLEAGACSSFTGANKVGNLMDRMDAAVLTNANILAQYGLEPIVDIKVDVAEAVKDAVEKTAAAPVTAAAPANNLDNKMGQCPICEKAGPVRSLGSHNRSCYLKIAKSGGFSTTSEKESISAFLVKEGWGEKLDAPTFKKVVAGVLAVSSKIEAPKSVVTKTVEAVTSVLAPPAATA